MKHFIAVALLVLVLSCKKEDTNLTIEPKTCIIKGTVEGLKQGKLYLEKQTDSTWISIDSLVVDGNATFRFKMPLESPQVVALVLNRGVTKSIDNRLLIFAEEGIINVTTNLDGFYSKATITGSKNQDIWEKYKKLNSMFTDKNTALIAEELRAIRFNRTQDYDSIIDQKNQLLKRKILSTINFALQHKDKEIAPFLALTEAGMAQPKYLDTLYNALPKKIAQSLYGRELKKYIEYQEAIISQ